MSAHVVKLAPKPQTFDSTLPGFAASCDAVRLQIAACATVGEAFALYTQLRRLSEELLALTDRAAQQCDDIMGRM